MKHLIRSKREYIHLRNARKEYRIAIYRLVLLTFIGPCPENMEACHKDGDKYNNRLDNLRWDTKINNFKDNLNNNQSKLTIDIIRKIRYFSEKGFKRRDISNHFNIPLTTVTYIFQRKVWKYVI